MEASKCPKCGDEPHFVESVEKWYCYGCNSYLDDTEHVHSESESGAESNEHEVGPAVVEPTTNANVQTCMKCGAELEQIKDGKLYCYVCETYPEEIKEEPKEEPKPESVPEVKIENTENEAKALLESIPEPEPVRVPVVPRIEAGPEPVAVPAVPTAQAGPEKLPDVKACPTCGQPMKWIEKYQRNYCYGCRKYAPKEGAVSAASSAPKLEDNGHKHCPECKGELKFIEKYKEFYCYTCKKYPLRAKKIPAPPASPNTCLKCGGQLKFIDKYQRHYCFSCKEYAPKANGGSSEKKTCPTCSSDMKFVSEYNEWYCYKCKKYSLRPAKPVLLF